MSSKLSKLKPGQMLGPYRIIAPLAEGGMGEVYEAFEDSLHRRIAIKVVAGKAESDPDMLERFKNEGRTLAKLQHPNVLAVYSFGEFESMMYMATEFIDGWSLDRFLLQSPCSIRELLKLFAQMLEGLEAAHRQGIVHRDIKPSNIMIDRQHVAKLVDFGIAKAHNEAVSIQTSVNAVMRTANYLAPEVTRGFPATARSDIFSMGLVLYYLLTGKTPFTGANYLEVLEKIRNEDLHFQGVFEALLPAPLKAMLSKMTAKRPEDRYGSAREILNELGQINFDNLPDELLHPVSTSAILNNFPEVKMKCEQEGFDSGEVRFIVNLAAGLETGKVSEDKTMVSQNDAKITISESSLDAAIERYRGLRTRLLKRVTSSNRLSADLRLPALSSPAVRWVGAALAVALVALFIQSTFRPERYLASIVTEAPLPSFKVGQKHILRFSGTEDEKITPLAFEDWTITEVTASEYRANWEHRRVRRHLNPFLPLIEVSSIEDGEVQVLERNDISGDPNVLFPLKIGSMSKNHVKGQGMDGLTWEFDFRCIVVGKEAITVEAGTFDTFRVECVEAGEKHHVEKTAYYAPSIGYIVKQERRFHRNREIRKRKSLELIKYEL